MYFKVKVLHTPWDCKRGCSFAFKGQWFAMFNNLNPQVYYLHFSIHNSPNGGFLTWAGKNQPTLSSLCGFLHALLRIQDEASELSDVLLTAAISFIFRTFIFYLCGCVCRCPQVTRQSVRSLELESQAVGSHLVGAGNWTLDAGPLWEQPVVLTTRPSLQPLYLASEIYWQHLNLQFLHKIFK